MGTTTYYVALAFVRSEDGDIVACEPKEVRSAENPFARPKDPRGDGRALRGHRVLANCRSGARRLFDDAVILRTIGEVDSGLLTG
jgi:hypothetical protein